MRHNRLIDSPLHKKLISPPSNHLKQAKSLAQWNTTKRETPFFNVNEISPNIGQSITSSNRLQLPRKKITTIPISISPNKSREENIKLSSEGRSNHAATYSHTLKKREREREAHRSLKPAVYSVQRAACGFIRPESEILYYCIIKLLKIN